jgi:hypothetical protein
MWSFLFGNKRNLFLFLKQLETVFFSSYLPEKDENQFFFGNNLEWPTLTINYLFILIFCKTDFYVLFAHYSYECQINLTKFSQILEHDLF